MARRFPGSRAPLSYSQPRQHRLQSSPHARDGACRVHADGHHLPKAVCAGLGAVAGRSSGSAGWGILGHASLDFRWNRL